MTPPRPPAPAAAAVLCSSCYYSSCCLRGSWSRSAAVVPLMLLTLSPVLPTHTLSCAIHSRWQLLPATFPCPGRPACQLVPLWLPAAPAAAALGCLPPPPSNLRVWCVCCVCTLLPFAQLPQRLRPRCGAVGIVYNTRPVKETVSKEFGGAQPAARGGVGSFVRSVGKRLMCSARHVFRLPGHTLDYVAGSGPGEAEKDRRESRGWKR